MTDPNIVTLLFAGIIFIGIIVTYIFFILTLQNTLKSISPENRTMAPGAVWRLLIPLYNFFFMFTMVQEISTSITNQLESSGETVRESKPTLNFGMAWCILTVSSIFLNLLGLSDLSSVVSVLTLICLALYWRKVFVYKKMIERMPELTLDGETAGNNTPW